MKIESARYEDGNLILKVPSSDGRRFTYNFKEGDYEIKVSRQRRSNDANAYAWKLISIIAEALRISPEEVYRRELKEVPNAYEWVLVLDDAVESLRKQWCGGHLGRRVETDTSMTTDFVNAYLYYGSSDFDTRQMSILIDSLIREAKSLGLETRPEEEVRAMLEAWK